jgi:cysteine-rich repeat protein
VCGNGIQEGTEECDIVPAIPQICTSSCTWVPAVCGDGFRQNGETCDDGNTVNGDACPSNCVINTCAPTATRVQATISYSKPTAVSVGSIVTFLDYPDGRVGIPGVGGAASVANRITALIPPVPAGYGDTDNDLDYAVNVLLSKTPPLAVLPAGPLYTVSFDLCFNQTVPPASAFTCRVTQAVDTSNADINLTTNPMSCSVTIP